MVSLTEDFDLLAEIVSSVDPSFRGADQRELAVCLDDARQQASANRPQGFVLAAMRVMALANNGHTRVIPNAAISVLPMRFVSIGSRVHLLKSSLHGGETPIGELIAVNDMPVEDVLSRSAAYLAGTKQRKRVIGPILLSWPFALSELGVSSANPCTTYRVRNTDGNVFIVKLDHDDAVPAGTLYPRNEHGRSDPDWAPETFANIHECDVGLAIALPSFFDPSGDRLEPCIAQAAERVSACRGDGLLLDVRGNTGGDFLRTLPLIEAISQHPELRQVAVLVDKFTFSAAIVFVALLKHRLGQRLTIFGEEMGDRTTFFAEGDLVTLQHCGAELRYSTAFHDWTLGSVDDTTPEDIAKHVVAAGSLEIDRGWIASPSDLSAPDSEYRTILRSL